jgi:hypothetical protein
MGLVNGVSPVFEVVPDFPDSDSSQVSAFEADTQVVRATLKQDRPAWVRALLLGVKRCVTSAVAMMRVGKDVGQDWRARSQTNPGTVRHGHGSHCCSSATSTRIARSPRRLHDPSGIIPPGRCGSTFHLPPLRRPATRSAAQPRAEGCPLLKPRRCQRLDFVASANRRRAARATRLELVTAER